jgi:hypothetical protein
MTAMELIDDARRAMMTNKNSNNSKQTPKVLTDVEYKKIAKSFDRIREKSMKRKRKDTLADFIDAK